MIRHIIKRNFVVKCHFTAPITAYANVMSLSILKRTVACQRHIDETWFCICIDSLSRCNRTPFDIIEVDCVKIYFV